MAMTNLQLVADVASRTGLSQKDVKKVFDVLPTAITHGLEGHEAVVLKDVVKFKRRHQPERQRTNPQNPTGPKVTVPAGYVVKVTPATGLRNAVAASE